MSGGTNSFFISSTVQELWVFENSLKSAKNAKNINFSEILKICKVQIKEFYLILISEFHKTSKILNFQKFWKYENSSFGFYVHLKKQNIYIFQKIQSFESRKIWDSEKKYPIDTQDGMVRGLENLPKTFFFENKFFSGFYRLRNFAFF